MVHPVFGQQTPQYCYCHLNHPSVPSRIKFAHARKVIVGQKGGGSLFRTTALPPNWTRSRVQECLRPSCLHLTSSFTGQKEYDLVTVGTTSITQPSTTTRSVRTTLSSKNQRTCLFFRIPPALRYTERRLPN